MVMTAAEPTTTTIPGVPERKLITYARNGVYVTPEMAAAFIAHARKNRKVRPLVAEAYGRDMLNHQWYETGATLAFDREGYLQDGQHRCRAAVATGIGFWALIVGDLDPSAFEYMDIGMKRTVADVLGLKDHKDAALSGAIVSNTIKYRRGEIRQNDPVTRPETFAFAEENRGTLAKIIDLYTSKTTAKKLLRSGQGGWLLFEFYQRDPVMAELMLNELNQASGTLPPNDPIMMLRERLFRDATSTTRLNRIVLTAYVIQAWNASVTGNKLGVLRWTMNQDLPAILPELPA